MYGNWYYGVLALISCLYEYGTISEIDLEEHKHSYTFLQTNLVVNLTIQNNYNNCVCVPYWQCKEDFSGFVEDVDDIIDIRMSQDENDEEPCTGDFDVCCQIECGRLSNGLKLNQSPDVGFRILEGSSSDADFAEFPWMLGLLQDKVFKCGASLIHPQVAITAAHCVSNNGLFKVRAGEWNWDSTEELVPHQDRFTQKIIIHPQYHPGSLRNDIAILILNSQFQLTDNVGIICLPPANSRFHNVRCTASGWGKNSFRNGAYQSTLKKVELPVVPQNICLQSLRKARLGPYFNLHRSFICAGGENNKDTCKGDGGSPLICPITGQRDRYHQAGIVSWGLTCGLQNTPGVYVNVALFRDWIDHQLSLHNFDITIYRSW